MKFRTEIEIPKFNHSIKPQTKLFLCGSCFTQNIGLKFKTGHFNTLYNPFGTLYNPISIANCIQRIVKLHKFTKADFFPANNRWQSYELHGDYAAETQNLALQKINQSIEKAHKQLLNSEFVFLTLGSAFVFELKENNKIVANCHKQSSQLFKRRLLSPQEIKNAFQSIISHINKFNPSATLIFTISPIRHWRDGALGNQVSKSNLFTVLYEFIKNEKIIYFPAYEIVMDELRDYRYYADDMLHLSGRTVNYIWKKLQNTYFSKTAMNFYNEIQKINKALQHKPLNPQSEEYKQFKIKTLERIKKAELEYKIDFEN